MRRLSASTSRTSTRWRTGFARSPSQRLRPPLRKHCSPFGVLPNDRYLRHVDTRSRDDCSTGPARRVLDALAANPEHIIALSPFIVNEVGKVLSYPRMQELFRLSAEDIQRHLDYLRSISRLVEPRGRLPVVLADPNDDAIVYTAVAAGADVLCVRDRHFYHNYVIRFSEREGIRILDDVALLELLG